VSTIVTVWMQGDPDRFEAVAAENEDTLREIRDRAVEAGVIAHRVYGSAGQIMMIDEWPDPETFERFFESIEDDLAPLLEAVGLQGEPAVNVWRKLDSRDEYGWD
jgi:hypothetical protein